MAAPMDASVAGIATVIAAVMMTIAASTVCAAAAADVGADSGGIFALLCPAPPP